MLKSGYQHSLEDSPLNSLSTLYSMLAIKTACKKKKKKPSMQRTKVNRTSSFPLTTIVICCTYQGQTSLLLYFYVTLAKMGGIFLFCLKKSNKWQSCALIKCLILLPYSNIQYLVILPGITNLGIHIILCSI